MWRYIYREPLKIKLNLHWKFHVLPSGNSTTRPSTARRPNLYKSRISTPILRATSPSPNGNDQEALPIRLPIPRRASRLCKASSATIFRRKENWTNGNASKGKKTVKLGITGGGCSYANAREEGTGRSTFPWDDGHSRTGNGGRRSVSSCGSSDCSCRGEVGSGRCDCSRCAGHWVGAGRCDGHCNSAHGFCLRRGLGRRLGNANGFSGRMD